MPNVALTVSKTEKPVKLTLSPVDGRISLTVGPQIGRKGDPGPIGPQGIQGVPGPQGIQGAAADTFETVAKNIQGYPVVASTFVPGVSLTKTFDSGSGTSIIITILFDVDGKPVTKTLSGNGVPVGIPTVCTYDFSGGRVVPLTSYS